MIAGTFDYGLTGCAALAQENLFATQFHPEKSHTAGLTLLKNFLDWEWHMLVIPAIDLKDGQCVRLRQGDMADSTVFSDDPVAMAQRWFDEGARRLHIVDLDGAFAGEPVNAGIIEAISKALPTLPIQIGGGIRNLETIARYLEAGVEYAIIGTMAAKDPDFVHRSLFGLPGAHHCRHRCPRAAVWRLRAGRVRVNLMPPISPSASPMQA